MIPKAALVAVIATGAATGLDGTAEKVVLYGAAITGLAVLWRMVIRPAGMMIRHGGRIVKRTSEAVESLEHLPARWEAQEARDKETDQRLTDVEAEVGIVSNELGAIRRKLGVSDDDVRRTPTPDRRHTGL